MSAVTRQLIDVELGGANFHLEFASHEHETMAQRLVELWGESDAAAEFIGQLLGLADRRFTVESFYASFVECIRKFHINCQDCDAIHILLSVPMDDLCTSLLEGVVEPRVCADYLDERLFSLVQPN